MISALLKKRPGSQVFSVEEDPFIKERLEELLHGVGLFDEKYIVVLKNLLQKEEVKEYLLEGLEKMTESPHVFILLEDKISQVNLKEVSKRAHVAEEFLLVEKKPFVFNIFSFTDAIGERDAFVAWKTMNTGLLFGKDVEELRRLAFWMVKSIQAAKISKDAKEADMKTFSYNKAKRYVGNYTKKELQELSLCLLEASQKDRRGEVPLRFSLEKIVLGL